VFRAVTSQNSEIRELYQRGRGKKFKVREYFRHDVVSPGFFAALPGFANREFYFLRAAGTNGREESRAF
jgi:hypothetical protein